MSRRINLQIDHAETAAGLRLALFPEESKGREDEG
jgi:hypothetical protein